MHPFEELFYNRIKSIILSWDEDFCQEVCLLAIEYGGQDNRTSCQYDFAFSYNTRKHFQSKVAEVGEWDAKWVPAEWNLDWVAVTPADEDEVALWHGWCHAREIPIDEELTNGPFLNGKTLYDYAALDIASIDLCCRVVQQLRAEKIIEKKFGEDRPVYIVNSEGWINKPPTVSANPQELLTEFLEANQDWED